MKQGTKIMTNTHLRSRSRDIATNLVNAWEGHNQAPDEIALPYIDHLMEALVNYQPTHFDQLVRKLQQMVPGLHYGTAKRLAKLKYGCPDRLTGPLPATHI
jgi:hypothetical protein